jgi:transposase
MKELIVKLLMRVDELEKTVQLLRNGRSSKTSHISPSHDIGRSNSKSLREKTGRKPGGQAGHEGNTLEIKAVPDEVVDHVVDYCPQCGEDLSHTESIVLDRKQEIVIPPIIPKYIEHRSHSRVCKGCGQSCVAALPSQLKAPVQYGANVVAAVSYLSVYQYLPYRRICSLLKNLFGIPLSEGSVDNMLEQMAQKAIPAYEAIKDQVQQADVVGSDETGVSIAGKLGWVHTWQTETHTFITASRKRGSQTIDQYYPQGFPRSVYVSDCLAAQLKVQAKSHQICTAHLLRELLNFEEALYCTWSKSVRILLLDAIRLKKQLKPEDYGSPAPEILTITERLDELLNTASNLTDIKIIALFKRLNKNKNSILTFLHHEKVPPDNNASERAIRNIKVKTKVSGQFRTERGAQRFAIIRSVIDTAIKSTDNILDTLSLLGNLCPE